MGYFFESQSSTGTFYTCNHRRVVIRVPQKKAANVDPPNSGLGRKWAECIDKEPFCCLDVYGGATFSDTSHMETSMRGM